MRKETEVYIFGWDGFLGLRSIFCWVLREREEALRSANEEAMGQAMARAKVTMETTIAGAWPE